MVAIMMELLELEASDKVLEIGTGCGYVTALLAEIVSEVYTVERIDDLMNNAKDTLKRLNYQNIFFKTGDGSLGWTKALPFMTEFDKIIISAGSPSVPNILLEQLKEGGKLVIPQGAKSYQELLLYEKVDGEIVVKNNGGCVFVPLIGEEGWTDEN
jgi:protein-L-isoaspartate(D-aspartate) O-methyltransferase